MNTIALNCNHCGGPLQIPEDAKYATCGFCETQLAVEHSGSVYFTRILKQLQESTRVISTDLEELKIRTSLERLEAEWDRKKHELLGKYYSSPPTVEGTRSVMLLCVIAAGVISCLAIAGGSCGVFLIPALGGGIIAASINAMAHQYETELAAYERRRGKFHRLLAELADGTCRSMRPVSAETASHIRS